MYYDESDNPSNGWRIPTNDEIPDQPSEEIPENLADPIQDLEPGGDSNPLEQAPLPYNPLNHAYPMIANTKVGIIELMVKFVIVRGKDNLPLDMIAKSAELQIPVSIEDVPVKLGESAEKSDDFVAENALISEMTGDERHYLIPAIVRARRLASGEIGSTDTWEPLTKDETAVLITGEALLDLITGYAEKVASDPEAPIGLLDLLDHFTGRARRNQVRYPDVDASETDVDAEWN
jgi:hypothetical protein